MSFFLADICLGRQCAQFSVILYGLSEIGLQVAGAFELSTRHPIQFFYVWMVYWTVQWVRQKDARYVAAAIVTWAIGLNVFLEMAPGIFILPLVWIYDRPPIRIRPLLIAAVLIGAVWYPYLHFEVGRDFVDLRSQIQRKVILPASFEQSWCQSDLAPAHWHLDSTTINAETDQASTRNQTTLSKAQSFVLKRARVILNTLQMPRMSLVVIPLSLLALALLCVQGFFSRLILNSDAESLWSSRLKRFATIMILGGLFMNEFIIGRVLGLDRTPCPSTLSTIRKCELALVLAGIALMALRDVIISSFKKLTINKPEGINNASEAAVLVISLLIPLVILCSLVEDADHPFRFWWLWPVEVVILASITTHWPLKLGIPRSWTLIGSGMLIVFAASNSLLLSRANSWMTAGWSGDDHEGVRVVDYAATKVKSDGSDQAAIGYDLFIDRWYATYNAADSRYKVGAQLDLFFRYRYGILNTSHCAEGTSRDDAYRIVQTRILIPWESDHINVALDPRFQVMQKLDSYQFLQRLVN